MASFFAKDMEMDWRLGAEHFEEFLVDHDPASNWGNWNYVAGVGFDPRQDRYFSVSERGSMRLHAAYNTREEVYAVLLSQCGSRRRACKLSALLLFQAVCPQDACKILTTMFVIFSYPSSASQFQPPVRMFSWEW